MSFIEKGVILPPGSSGDFDDDDTNFPHSVILDGISKMLYDGLNSAGNIRIGLSLSKDLLNQTKKGVVIPQNSGDYNSSHSRSPFVLSINGKFYAIFTGRGGGGGTKYRMALAISNDCLKFIEKGVTIPLGDSGDSDDSMIVQCSIIPLNGRFYLYYSASTDSSTTYQTNLAISKDLMNWTKKGVVMPLGSSGAPDDTWRAHPYVIYQNGIFYMYNISNDGTDKRISMSTSRDGLIFKDKGIVEPLGYSGNADEEFINALSPFYVNGKTYMYKVPVGYSSAKRIGLVVSNNKMSSPRPTRPLITDSACKFFFDGYEKTGTIGLNDESGNGNDGTLTGVTWGTDGPTWDGDNDLGTIPYDASLNLLDGNFTVVIGHKFNTLPSVKGAKENLVGEQSGTGSGRNWFTCEETANKYTSALGGVLYTSTAVATAGWHLGILRFDGTNVDITLDDVTAAGVARTPEAADGDFIIGKHQKASQGIIWFDGIMDVIILFNKSLSTAEMTELYDWHRRRH